MFWEYLSQGGHEHWGELSKGTVVQGRFKVVSNSGGGSGKVVRGQHSLEKLAVVGKSIMQINNRWIDAH